MANIKITATGLADDNTALNDLTYKIYNGSTDALIGSVGSHTSDANVTVTGTTVVIDNFNAGALGVGDTVKVTAVDGSSLESTLSNAFTITAGDVTAPLYTSSVVEDASPSTLTMTYNETLDSGSVPAVGDFAVNDGASNTVTNVAINGATVVLTLTNAIENGDTVTVSYTKGSNPIQDSNSNESVNLTTESVTNNVVGSTIIVFEDDFTGVTIDETTKWDIEDANSNLVFSQNDKLTLTCSGTSTLKPRIITQATFDNAVNVVSFDLDVDNQNANQWSIGLRDAIPSNDGMYFQKTTVVGSLQFFMVIAGSSTSTVVFASDISTTKSFKMVDNGTTVKVYEWVTSAWVEKGSYSGTMGAVTKGTAHMEGNANQVMNVDNFYICDADFSTQYPT